MSQEYDLARTELASGVPAGPDALSPGRSSRSAQLSASPHPIVSGLIQRKARDSAGVAEDAESEVAAATTSSSSPLPPELRSRFEFSLGTDLSSARIHTGAESARASAAVGAKAYTLGNDIHFAADHFDPSSPAGQRLLAHEVVHTVHQRGGSPHRQNKLEVSSPGDALEREADRVAEAMVTGAPIGLSAAGGDAAGTVHRQQDPSAGAGQGRSVPSFGVSALPSGRQLSSTEWTLQGFATDSAVLTLAHQQTITQIANDLNAGGLGYNGFVTITGHADSRGTDEHNQQLGQQRADSVRASLIALLADPQTAQQVRAYSTGEADNERDGDVAEYRQVTVTVNRGTLPLQLPQLSLPSLQPGQQPGSSGTPHISVELPPELRPRVFPPTGPAGPRAPTLPPNFWTLPSPRPASRNVLDQLIHDISVWLTGELGREQIARMAAWIAERLGMDRAEVERKLNEAMISGGEEGLQQALQALIQAIAGPPTDPPSSPYGPATQEIPTPPIIQIPIPIPGW